MVAMMLNSPTVARAELNVLMSGGFGGAYEKLLPEFERTSGVKVTTRSGASQGSGPQTIAAQLARGVPADVVILSREGLTELIAANKITGGTDVNLAQVPLGIAVREKAPKPDVSTVVAFKQTMTKAKKIALIPKRGSSTETLRRLEPERVDVGHEDQEAGELLAALRRWSELGGLLDGVDGVATRVREPNHLGSRCLRLQQERGEVGAGEGVTDLAEHLLAALEHDRFGVALEAHSRRHNRR